MRRPAKGCPLHIYRIYKYFFWKQCDHCKLEFRRLDGWYCSSRDLKFFLCSFCRPTRSSARIYFKSKIYSSSENKRNYITT